MSEHRVSMLGASLSRHPDPTRSRDPRVREVLAQLKTLQVAPEPRAHFRAELRAQLVAVTPRLVAEGTAAETPMIDIARRPSPIPKSVRAFPAAPARHTDSEGLLAKLRRVPIARALAVVASVMAAFALLLGGAVWLSQKSLPGDALYGLKRASERVELATAASDTEKAKDYLDFATTRAGEVQSLLGRTTASAFGTRAQAAGAVNPHTAALITSTLASADSDVKSASTLLGNQAVRSGSGKSLSTMTDWAPGQLKRLAEIATAMPSGALRNRAVSSAQLVAAANSRAGSLQQKAGCSCMTGAATDELGPVPCVVCTAPGNPSTPGKGGSHTTKGHSGTKLRTGKSTPAPNQPTPGGTTAPNAPVPTSPVPIPTPGLHLPSLPIPLPTSVVPPLPVTVSSCGASVNLGPIHIGLGSCPPGSSHP